MERIVEIPDNIKRRVGELIDFVFLTGWPVREKIVRCRDCRFAYMRGQDLVCNVNHRFVALDDHGLPLEAAYFICSPNGFCSWGEAYTKREEMV